MVCLIENDTVPLYLVKRGGLFRNHAVCCDDDGCCFEVFLGVILDACAAMVNERCVVECPDDGVFPLFKKRSRQNNESMPLEITDDGANHLYCFAESHLVCDETTSHSLSVNNVSTDLVVDTPLDTRYLMFLGVEFGFGKELLEFLANGCFRHRRCALGFGLLCEVGLVSVGPVVFILAFNMRKKELQFSGF